MDQRRRATSGLERSGLGTVSGTYFCSKCRHSRRERRAHPSGVGGPRAPPAPAHMRRPPGRSRSGFSSRPTLTRRYWLKRSGSGPTGAVSAGRRMLEGVGHISPGRCKAAKSGANPVLSRNCDAPRGRARSTACAERTPALGGRAVRAAPAAGPPPPLNEEVLHQRTLSRVATPAVAAPEQKRRNACADLRALLERRQGLGPRSLEVAPRAARA